MPAAGSTTAHRRRRRGVALVTAVAVCAPILLLGGAIARAAVTPSGPPLSVSVTWSGPDGQRSGHVDVPTAPTTPTSTTTLPRPATGHSTTGGAPSTAPTPGGVGVAPPSDAAGGGAGGGSLQQTLVVQIRPGPLTVSPSTEPVSLTYAHPDAHATSLYRGDLAPVTVVDARGSLVGWHATISLQAVSGLEGTAASRALLCANPSAPTMVAGNPNDIVRADTHTCAHLGETISLFYAAPGGGGGTYRDTAGLTLDLPGGTHPDAVTASLAIAVH